MPPQKPQHRKTMGAAKVTSDNARKKRLGVNVYEAAKDRIRWTFDTFPRVYLSFSGGKDSTVMFHLVAEVARERNEKFGVLLVDLEAQYKLTVDHCQAMFDMYADLIYPYWCCVPIQLRNAVSAFQTEWVAWDHTKQSAWVRQPPDMAITNPAYFPFFGNYSSFSFDTFVSEFGNWYSEGEATACFVGIRTAESLNRWRTIAGHGTKFEGVNHTNRVMKALWNVYPIYDWKVEDLWHYHAVNPELPYNRLYDRMYQAGLTPHQMRICQPYGDDQRKGLWLFHSIEPETWAKVVYRVNGANQGALYAKETGNILGNGKISKPVGHTWESFAMLLLESLPDNAKEHYKNKIAKFIHHYKERGISMVEDLERSGGGKGGACWERICKALLRNDFWCKSLSFSPTSSTNHTKYIQQMQKRRKEWGILDK